jgi:hypothetical protein
MRRAVLTSGAVVAFLAGGDALNGWRLTWSFPSGQSVAQAWNASVTQSGAAVTTTNLSYNGSVATNGSVCSWRYSRS